MVHDAEAELEALRLIFFIAASNSARDIVGFKIEFIIYIISDDQISRGFP